jgi:FG-GAP-like repeat
MAERFGLRGDRHELHLLELDGRGSQLSGRDCPCDGLSRKLRRLPGRSNRNRLGRSRLFGSRLRNPNCFARNSGGPLWFDDNGSDEVAGVVSTTGWATQLTTADWNQIEGWVSADGYTLGTTPSYIAPTVAALANLSLREGQSISASSLIVSLLNPSGDAITEDLYVDLGGGSGYFTVNGVRQADGVWFSASPSADVEYVGGSSPGRDTLEVGIYDSTTNSSIYASNPVVATTVGRGNTPGTASDILFQNTDGQVAIWDMSGLNVVGGGTVGLDPGPQWQAIGTGGFGGGDPDILFQNASSGQVAIWDMDGTNIVGGGTVAPDPGPSWRAVGTGDFYDDGHSDILWQNANGQVAIWDMNGIAVTGGGALGPDPGSQWQAIGTGDFNDDGHSDILFQNTSSGQVAVWDVDGASIVGGGIVGLNPGPSWQAVGTGDFNGDGHSDILFQNPSSGRIAIWEMNGTNAIGGGVVSADPGPSWRAVGTGGGGSDILFQSMSGQAAVWDMSGTNIIGGGTIATNAGPSWRAVGLT